MQRTKDPKKEGNQDTAQNMLLSSDEVAFSYAYIPAETCGIVIAQICEYLMQTNHISTEYRYDGIVYFALMKTQEAIPISMYLQRNVSMGIN